MCNCYHMLCLMDSQCLCVYVCICSERSQRAKQVRSNARTETAVSCVAASVAIVLAEYVVVVTSRMARFLRSRHAHAARREVRVCVFVCLHPYTMGGKSPFATIGLQHMAGATTSQPVQY